MTKHREQIVAAAEGKVPEEILGAAFAKPRGATTAAAAAGAAAREIGAQWSRGHHVGGPIEDVEEILSSVPLGAVDSLTVKRFGLAGVMETAAGGSRFEVEGKVNDLRELAAAFDRAKASA